MWLLRLYAPNGKGSVDVHPARVEQMKSQGWTEKKPAKIKSEKKEVKL